MVILLIKTEVQRPGSRNLVGRNSKKVKTQFDPKLGETLNTKTAKFWCSRYILILVKSKNLKISGAKHKILMNTVSKSQPQIHCILGDMISQSQGSSLFQKSSINMTPGENCNILGYRVPNGIHKDILERVRTVPSVILI